MSKMVVSEKRWPKCSIVKPSDAFNKNAGAHDRMQPYCRECSVEGNRARALDIRRRRIAGQLPTHTVESKICAQCKERKNSSEIGISLASPDGLSSWCRLCTKHIRIEQKYGMNRDAYGQMIEAQQGACAICKQVLPLVVDHCHKSSEVRGLLCGACNKMIGFAKDNPSNLENAINYLMKWSTK